MPDARDIEELEYFANTESSKYVKESISLQVDGYWVVSVLVDSSGLKFCSYSVY